MWLTKLKNSKGFSLIEVLISAGLMALVASGMIGLVTSMNKEQNNQYRLSALRELKTRFQFLISDQGSWNKTLERMYSAGDPLAVCIRDQVTCAALIGVVSDLTLHDNAGNPYFVPPANTLVSPSWPGNSAGFSDKGSPCTGFNGNTGAGVDTCPFTYKVVWEPICTGTCINPLIRVTVRLIYNPGSKAPALPLGSGNLTTSAFDTDDSVADNTGKYDVVMKRSAKAINKSFTLNMTNNYSVLPTGEAAPGGNCQQSPTFGVRGKTSAPESGTSWNEVDDSFDLVTVDIATGEISIMPGTYSCRITAVGWAVNTFTIQLRAVSPSVVVPGSIATGTAAQASLVQATATSTPIVSVGGSVPAVYVVEQTCQTATGLIAPGPTFTMGMPTPNYDQPSVYGTFSCTQTN